MAAVAGRRASRATRWSRRPRPACSRWRSVAEGMDVGRSPTSATCRRSTAQHGAPSARRSSSTWRPSRWCASPTRAGRDLRHQRDGHGARARGGAPGRQRALQSSCVTSDKCYENREWIWGYREDEPMGGHDPYSSSKGCAELRDLRLPPLVLQRQRRSRRVAIGARRQRHRRRRLGGGPPGPRHPARL